MIQLLINHNTIACYTDVSEDLLKELELV